jgi:uncharacterized protein
MNEYEIIFDYVKKQLEKNDTEATKTKRFPFRVRSEHLWRVFLWAKRLLKNDFNENINININKNAVLVAALFHDSGYALSLDGDHAENSAKLFTEYAKQNRLNNEEINFIAYLIENHSKKYLMKEKGTPIELIVLMEADILDETGAMGIVWDCMAEGMREEQSYKKTCEHIIGKSYKIIYENPMITKLARERWKKKQEMTKEFIKQYLYDLGMEQENNNDL